MSVSTLCALCVLLLFASVDDVVVMVDEITYGDFIGTHDIEADCCTDEVVVNASVG